VTQGESPMKHSTRIAGGYLALSVAWIGVSDPALSYLFPALFPTISLYKGWAFVIATAALLKYWLAAEEARRDVTENKFRDLAIHDPLTGLLNRGAFTSHLENAIERARRSNATLALLFIDLDGFKAVNDTMGHAFGDEVLRAAVDRFRVILRAADTAGRLGGDEFVILVDPETANGAEILAQRLLDAFRVPFTLQGTSVAVTLSVGIARFPDHSDQAEYLLRAADRAMYVAKASGKNAFTLAEVAVA